MEQLAELYIASLQMDADARRTAGPEKSPRVGDLWTTRGTRSEDLPVLVAITYAESDDVRAVVAFEEPELAASDDVLVSGDQSPTGGPLVLCSWRDVPVLPKDLERLIGVLPDAVIEPLAMMLQQRVSGGFKRVPVGVVQLPTGETALRWTIEPEDRKTTGCEYLTGAQILLQNDPRLRVRAQLMRHTQYLERDVMESMGELEMLNEETMVRELAQPAVQRFPVLADSGRLAELARWKAAAAATPRVFPVAA